MAASSSNKTQQQLPIPPPPKTLHPDVVKSTKEWLSAQTVPSKQDLPAPKAVARSEEEIKAARPEQKKRRRQKQNKQQQKAEVVADKATGEEEPPTPDNGMGELEPASCEAGDPGPLDGVGEQLSKLSLTAGPGTATSSVVKTDEDDNVPRNQLDCMYAAECRQVKLRWTEFMLSNDESQPNEDSSWQGKIWGMWQPCSGLAPIAFKKEARRRKEARAQHLRGKRDRARSITFSNMEAIIANMCPHASHRLIRKLAVMRTKAIAASLLHAFENESSEL
jgi:hypothetical protein